jgi:nucleoporin POM34
MLAEIVRRQNAATFGEKNVKQLVWNGAAFIMTCALGGTVKQ